MRYGHKLLSTVDAVLAKIYCVCDEVVPAPDEFTGMRVAAKTVLELPVNNGKVVQLQNVDKAIDMIYDAMVDLLVCSFINS